MSCRPDSLCSHFVSDICLGVITKTFTSSKLIRVYNIEAINSLFLDEHVSFIISFCSNSHRAQLNIQLFEDFAKKAADKAEDVFKGYTKNSQDDTIKRMGETYSGFKTKTAV